jgi:hypothetical protein
MIMKKFLFILTVIAGLFVSNAEARMKIRIPVDNSIPKVAALPDSSYYKTDEGAHLDLGYIEEDGKRTLVLFSESKPDTYYEISDEYAEVIKKDLNVEELSSLIPSAFCSYSLSRETSLQELSPLDYRSRKLPLLHVSH